MYVIFEALSTDRYAFHASVIVLVYMIVRVLLFSITQRYNASWPQLGL